MLQVRNAAATPSCILALFFFVINIVQASTWQNFNHKRLSTTPSNRTVMRKHHDRERLPYILQRRSHWSAPSGRYHQNLRLLRDTFQLKAYNDDKSHSVTEHFFVKNGQKQRFTKFFATSTQKFLSTAMIICVCCINSEVSAASVIQLQNAPTTFYSTTTEPIRETHSEVQPKNYFAPHTRHNNFDKRHQWIFENGEVILPEVIYAHGLKLTNPRLLGSGAGGAVFVLQNEQLMTVAEPEQIALKVSWKDSTKSVSNECNILKKLQEASIIKYGSSISTIEKCLGEVPYEADTARSMILLQPVFGDKQASSLQDFAYEPDKMKVAVTQIIQTLLQMLSENIVTIDVQPLISRQTGRLLFIDFTEATIVNIQSSINDADKAAIRNFINEMMVLIPEPQHDVVVREIFLIEKVKYPIRSIEVYEMLLEQFL